MRFPLQPLIDAVAHGRVVHQHDGCPCQQGGLGRALGYCMTNAEIAEQIGVHEGTFSRHLKLGLSLSQADRWACAAGYATVTVWPEWAAEADRVYGTDQEEAA